MTSSAFFHLSKKEESGVTTSKTGKDKSTQSKQLRVLINQQYKTISSKTISSEVISGTRSSAARARQSAQAQLALGT